jgi:hypothetical protein
VVDVEREKYNVLPTSPQFLFFMVGRTTKSQNENQQLIGCFYLNIELSSISKQKRKTYLKSVDIRLSFARKKTLFTVCVLDFMNVGTKIK